MRTVAGGVNVQDVGTGPHAVVLVHGFSDNLLTWHRVVPALAVEHRVVTIDLPGHGLTTRAWTRPLLEGYADVIVEVLDELGVEGRIGVVGNSMGAATAAVFGERHPERADGLALIGMPGLTGVPTLWRALASRPASVAMRTAFAPVPMGRLRTGFSWIYTHAASPHAGMIDPSVLRSYRDSYPDRARLFGLSGIARALLAELRPHRLELMLEQLQPPVLQIWGRHDRLVPPRRVIRGENAVVLPNCGHCPQLDTPDELLAPLLPFLSSCAAAGTTRAASG